MQAVTTIGLDIAKSVFQIHGVDAAGNVIVRRQLKRRYVLPFFQKLPACLIGMEACASSHHWSRELTALGHTVRLMPAVADALPLPAKDGGVLRTIGDAHAYMMALPKKRRLRAHWQHTARLLLQQASAAPLTRQVHLALFMDGKLDAGAFEHMSSARRWRRHALTS